MHHHGRRTYLELYESASNELDDLTRRLHERTKEDPGYAAAIEKLKSYDAEVIFSDISMPGMTGYELARTLRSTETTARLCLVAMTGHGQASDRDKAMRAGFDEHMVKPVDVVKLKEFFASLS